MILDAGFKAVSRRCGQAAKSHEVGDGLGRVHAPQDLWIGLNEPENLLSWNVLGASLQLTSIGEASLVGSWLPDEDGAIFLTEFKPA